MSLDTILIVLALACFLFAALSVPTGRVNLVAAGLFLALLSTVT